MALTRGNKGEVATETQDHNFVARATGLLRWAGDSGCLSGEDISGGLAFLIQPLMPRMFSHNTFDFVASVSSIQNEKPLPFHTEEGEVNTSPSLSPFFVKYVLDLAGSYTANSLLIICQRFSYHY